MKKVIGTPGKEPGIGERVEEAAEKPPEAELEEERVPERALSQ